MEKVGGSASAYKAVIYTKRAWDPQSAVSKQCLFSLGDCVAPGIQARHAQSRLGHCSHWPQAGALLQRTVCVAAHSALNAKMKAGAMMTVGSAWLVSW